MPTSHSQYAADPAKFIARSRRYQQENPEKVRRAKILRRYGLSGARYDKMLRDQDNRCAICKRHINQLDSPLAVDHDHKCCLGSRSCGKCVRGLLCNRCNTAIGWLDDDISLLQSAMAYLQGHIDDPFRTYILDI